MNRAYPDQTAPKEQSNQGLHCLLFQLHLLNTLRFFAIFRTITGIILGVLMFFSSPEPKAPGELIGWEGSVVRRPSVRPSVCPSVRRPSTISNDFSSETTGPIATKFHIQPPGPLGKKR